MRDFVAMGAGAFPRETVRGAERMSLQYPQWNILSGVGGIIPAAVWERLGAA